MINLLHGFLVLATSVGLSFTPVPQAVPVGEEFKVVVNVSSAGRETLGTDAVIIFDPKVLSATKIRAGKVYPNYPPNLQDIDNVHGKVLLTGTVGFKKPVTVEGVLGTFYFRAKKIGVTKIGFDWKPGGTADSNIVPAFGGLDLLTEKPEEITLSFRKASFAEKIVGIYQRVLLLIREFI